MFGKQKISGVAWVKILVPSTFYVTVHLKPHKRKLEMKWYMIEMFILRAYFQNLAQIV
jgi:hypothetical protein